MQTFNSFINHLKTQLNGSSLPGVEAQLGMAPITRLEELKRLKPGVTPRQSAVLVLFYPHDGETKLVFIKRPEDDSVHSGQIAFPGGGVEPEDKDFTDTALREANEEVNVDPSEVKVLGTLSRLHIPPSNFDVYPIIAYTNSRPDFNGNNEVDRIIEVRLSELLHPQTKTTQTIKHRLGKLVDVPCYVINDEIIWGATAMMISELITLLQRP
jgi:8-oxo-dGTP pyrophosphatase MutT (NUDIX family)